MKKYVLIAGVNGAGKSVRIARKVPKWFEGVF